MGSRAIELRLMVWSRPHSQEFPYHMVSPPDLRHSTTLQRCTEHSKRSVCFAAFHFDRRSYCSRRLSSPRSATRVLVPCIYSRPTISGGFSSLLALFRRSPLRSAFFQQLSSLVGGML